MGSGVCSHLVGLSVPFIGISSTIDDSIAGITRLGNGFSVMFCFVEVGFMLVVDVMLILVLSSCSVVETLLFGAAVVRVTVELVLFVLG